MDVVEEETLARLQDTLDALYEAQPKTVKERMQKYIENRSDSQVAKVKQAHASTRKYAAYTVSILSLMLIAVVINKSLLIF
jgi:adenylate kinase